MAKKTLTPKKNSPERTVCRERLQEQEALIQELQKKLERVEGEKRFLLNMLVERDAKRWRMKNWWKDLLGA